MSDSQNHIQYDAEGIQQLEATLGINAGNLSVGGGAPRLVDAEFVCSDDAWQPTVDYTVKGDTGRLSIVQSSVNGGIRFFERRRNDWAVQFANDVPLSLVTEMSASKADIDVSALTLRDLDLLTNAGRVDLALLGDHDALVSAYVEANATLINASISGSFRNLKLVDMELNAVKATLDLTGPWAHSQDFAIEANAGWLKLRLPNNVGVKIYRDSTMTQFKHAGFRKTRHALVNDAYDTAPITLTFDIEANVGRVELELTDKIPVTI